MIRLRIFAAWQKKIEEALLGCPHCFFGSWRRKLQLLPPTLSSGRIRRLLNLKKRSGQSARAKLYTWECVWINDESVDGTGCHKLKKISETKLIVITALFFVTFDNASFFSHVADVYPLSTDTIF